MPYAKLRTSRIYYEFYHNEGIPLVFIHGWAGDHSKWKKQVDFFSMRYPVIVFDLAGHGQSDPTEEYSINNHSKILHELLEYLGISQIYLVGHSMGGMVAQQFAIDFPENICKLILLSTTLKIINSFKDKLAVLLMRFLLRISFRRYCKILFTYTQPPNISPGELAMKMKEVYSMHPKIVRKTFAEMTSYNSSNKLSSFNKPTLLIVGEKDRIITPEMTKTLQKTIPQSELLVIQGGYHEIMLENSDEVNEAILKFIEST